MKLKELLEIVSTEAGITEEQANTCINIVFKMFTEISEDELTELVEHYEKVR